MAKADMSNYWIPTLYFAFANGSFAPVEQVGGATIYYLHRANKDDETKIMGFPVRGDSTFETSWCG